MSYQKRVVEARGANVEAAIEAGLARLKMKRQDVIVEIIDEGSSGILGLGRREAVVSLTGLVKVEDEQPVAPAPPPVVEVKVTPPTPPIPPAPPVAAAPAAEKEELSAESVQTAREVVAKLLTLLQVEATIAVDFSAEDDITGRQVPILKIEGENLGALIGPRGNTLQALQFLARAIVSQKLQQPANFIVDVEGYRERRAEMLMGLAERTAAKVIRERYAIALNPMPPNERRIIHMALRDNAEVVTKSEGEGDQRRVRIFPAQAMPPRPGSQVPDRPEERPRSPQRRR